MPSIWLQRIALFLSLNWIFWQNYFNELPSDIGDGIMHYFISNAVWSDPINLLDHWGKPFYILMSCAFTILGMNGVVFFNMLTFALTVWVGWKIIDHLKIAEVWKVGLPFLLVLTPEYAVTMLSALTEPLFSLVFLTATLFFLQKKWALFAIFMGILPFCRSEGQLAWILALAILAFYRQWKTIPFLALPFVIYGIAGWFALGDFMWYFNQSPYSMGNDIYGRGTWAHYFISYKNYLGNHGLVLLVLSFITLPFFIFKRKGTKDEWFFMVMSSGMFFAILAAHVIFWAKGLNGSMGLTRITTQALPSLLIVCFLLLDRFEQLNVLRKPLYPSLVILVGLSLYSFKRLKTYQDFTLMQMAIVNGSKKLNQDQALLPGKFFYHHPLFAINMGFNSNRPDDRSAFVWFRPYEEAKARMNDGDYVVWDGQFGPQEMGVAFQTLQSDSNFILLREYPSLGPFDINGLYLFQKVPAKYKQENGAIQSSVISSEVIQFQKGTNEFGNNIIEFSPEDPSGFYHLTFSKSAPVILTLSDQAHFVYETHPIDSLKTFDFYHQKGSELSVYIWNNNKVEMDSMTVKVEQIKKSYPKPYKP